MSTSLSARTPDPRLFTPGPLNTSETVRAAANRDLGSRTAAARGLTRQLCEEIEAIAGLGPGFCAIPLQGSGTFALEAMLTRTASTARAWLKSAGFTASATTC
jgi:2-aminoethylphosphonate-pyruvate transaminase